MTGTGQKDSLGGIFVWVLLLILVWGQAAAAKVVDRVVAVVNDEVISLSELEMMAKSIQAQPELAARFESDRALQRRMLESLIDQKLAQAEAKRRGISVTEEELNQAMEAFKRQNHIPDDAALAQALAKAGLSLNEMKQKIKDQILMDRLMVVTVGAKVTVTEEEMHRFYEQEYPKATGSLVHLQIIPIFYPPGADQAQKDQIRQREEMILKEYRRGVSLEELRNRYSLPLQDLGFISESDLAPRLAEFLRTLKPGEMGSIETPQGFQLVRLVERRSGRPKSYEEAKPEINKFLLRRKMSQKFSEYLKTLRDKAHIKIML
ncbi:MAG: SurA N-terminal domain-containing protein [Deltaproteobacteria bacterium]|nr:SurA N-terminal domain-containing protein [Deltaproteobacteria bacterium]